MPRYGRLRPESGADVCEGCEGIDSTEAMMDDDSSTACGGYSSSDLGRGK